MNRQTHTLQYDTTKWQEIQTIPVNTLQLFITNRCNLRCKGCFYAHGLNNTEMSVDDYRRFLDAYDGKFQKVILLGGEPTLHRNLQEILDINNSRKLKTTLYTNGVHLEKLETMSLGTTDVRIGVYGVYNSEKALSKVYKTKLPVKIVYMLRKNNIDELYLATKYAEENFDCKSFYVSSIRDITTTGDYWLDTDETISNNEFANIVQEFIDKYDGNIKRLDIATRGVLVTDKQDFKYTKHCRFGNVFPSGKTIRCPFDIGLQKFTDVPLFIQHLCDKHNKCILQKIVLMRK